MPFTRLFVALGALISLAAAPRGDAQVPGAPIGPQFSPAPQWELRLDATFSELLASHAGLGLNVRAGPYARVGFGVAAGGVRGADDEWQSSYRADVVARFLLDPFAERQRGFYGGAGISARRDGSENPVGHLVLLIGVEGRPTRPWIPSLEIALGGGTRVGIVLRRQRQEPAR